MSKPLPETIHKPMITVSVERYVEMRKELVDSVGHEIMEHLAAEEKRLADLFNGLITMLDRMIEYPELRTEMQLKRAKEYVESGRKAIPARKKVGN